MSKISLAVDLPGLRLRNPTLNAAGVLGMSMPLLKRIYDVGAGAVVTKSIGPNPRTGHINPTLVNVNGGILNAMGLPGPGADYFQNEIRDLKKAGVPVIGSFFGGTVEEFIEVAQIFIRAGVDALELNASCPNVAEELGMLASDASNIQEVTAAVKKAVDKPVYVKLSPNVTDIASIATAAKRGGADAITAVNTLKGLKVDVNFKRPVLKNITGGLSGPALKPVAIRCVWEIAEAVDLPIIGCGGISTWMDAVEYLLSGATAVQIGTAIMRRGLKIFDEINQGLRGYLEKNGFKCIQEMIGLAH